MTKNEIKSLRSAALAAYALFVTVTTDEALRTERGRQVTKAVADYAAAAGINEYKAWTRIESADRKARQKNCVVYV